jgi:hypothetical protein
MVGSNLRVLGVIGGRFWVLDKVLPPRKSESIAEIDY